jgi:hypothetical protein
MPQIQPPYGMAIFADDLRDEMHGKSSLMGIYGPTMYLPANTTFPVLLPKFAISMHWFEPVANYPDNIEFRIYLPGDEAGKPTAKYATNALHDQLKNAAFPEADEDGQVLMMLSPNVILSPVQLNQVGRVRVKVFRDGEEWPIGNLFIELAKPNAP